MSAVCCSSPAAAVRMVLSNDLPARTFFFTEISATPEFAGAGQNNIAGSQQR